MKKFVGILFVLMILISACAPSPETLAKQTAAAATSTAAAWTPTPASTATPVPTATPAFPKYSEILKTYPAGVALSCTKAEVSEVTADGQWTFTGGLVCPGQSQLTVESGGKFTTGELFFGRPWKSYGVKLTLKNSVTIDGKTYPAGTLLTVDKDLNWVQVSGWD